MLIAADLRDLEPRLGRHAHPAWHPRRSARRSCCRAYGTSVLLVGSSGSGKSTLAAGVLERLAECDYQFCVVDPEGDYREIADAIVLGDSQHEPSVAEVLDVLAKPGQSVVVNLLGIALERSAGVLSRPLAAAPGVAGEHRPTALDRCRRGPSPAAGRLGCRRADAPARARWHPLHHRASGTDGGSGALGDRSGDRSRQVA